MRNSLRIACTALIVAVISSVHAQDQSDNNFWMIGPRVLPAPDGASAQLREILAMTPTPMMPDVPTTVEGWKAQAAESDAKAAATAQAFAKEMNLQVAEESLGGVRVFRVTPPEVAPLGGVLNGPRVLR